MTVTQTQFLHYPYQVQHKAGKLNHIIHPPNKNHRKSKGTDDKIKVERTKKNNNQLERKQKKRDTIANVATEKL